MDSDLKRENGWKCTQPCIEQVHSNILLDVYCGKKHGWSYTAGKKSVESHWATRHSPCKNQVKKKEKKVKHSDTFSYKPHSPKHVVTFTHTHTHTHTPVDSSGFIIFPKDTVACELEALHSEPKLTEFQCIILQVKLRSPVSLFIAKRHFDG